MGEAQTKEKAAEIIALFGMAGKSGQVAEKRCEAGEIGGGRGAIFRADALRNARKVFAIRADAFDVARGRGSAEFV